MKKQLYFIVAMISLGLSSCSVNENESPKVIDIAFNITHLTAQGYGAGIAVFDIAYKADTWFSATTAEQREQFAAFFFPGFKIQITEDNLIEIGDICKINTNGVSLKSPNAKWSYTSKQYMIKDQYFPIEIQNTNPNRFTITVKDLPVPEGKSDFTVFLSNEDTGATVSGFGVVTYPEYGTANFTIKEGALTVGLNEPTTSGGYNDAFTQGEINISWQASGKEHWQAILANYKRSQIEIQTEGQTESFPKK